MIHLGSLHRTGGFQNVPGIPLLLIRWNVLPEAGRPPSSRLNISLVPGAASRRHDGKVECPSMC